MYADFLPQTGDILGTLSDLNPFHTTDFDPTKLFLSGRVCVRGVNRIRD